MKFPFQDIQNKVVESVWVTPDKIEIKFVFIDGTNYYLSCEGDCCSRSWFEHIEALDFKGQILSCDETFNCEDNEYGDTKTYFTTIKTEYGRLMIDMRNSSNGYYGGYYFGTNSSSSTRWIEV